MSIFFVTLELDVLRLWLTMSFALAKLRPAAFTLVEIMIVVAVLALLAAMAVTGFFRARKRSQATQILNDLRLIDPAVDQYAIECDKKTDDPVGVQDWTNYLKKDPRLYQNGADLFGDRHGAEAVDNRPAVPANVKNTLSNVADTAFWSPYQ